MGIPRKQLGTDERVILHLRSHGKALILPVLVLLLVSILVGAGVALMPPQWQPWGPWVLVGLGLLAVLVWSLRPFVRWASTTTTLTDRRVITRRGVLTKTGHDLPLSRINNVTYERSLMDRILGCGTLVFTTAAEAPVTLNDIPDVERVHVLISELILGADTPREVGE